MIVNFMYSLTAARQLQSATRSNSHILRAASFFSFGGVWVGAYIFLHCLRKITLCESEKVNRFQNETETVLVKFRGVLLVSCSSVAGFGWLSEEVKGGKEGMFN